MLFGKKTMSAQTFKLLNSPVASLFPKGLSKVSRGSFILVSLLLFPGKQEKYCRCVVVFPRPFLILIIFGLQPGKKMAVYASFARFRPFHY